MARFAAIAALCLAVVLCFGTGTNAAAEGSAKSPVDHGAALERLRLLRRTAHATTLDKAAAAVRSLKATVSEGPLSQACQNLVVQLAMSDCLERIPTGAQPPNASDVTTLCDSCVVPLRQFVVQCMTQSEQFITEFLDLLCSTSDGRYCGMEVSFGSACFSQKNATRCARNGDCRLNPKDGTCEVEPSVFCRPCFQNYIRFAARLTGVFSDELYDFQCVQVGGEYCLDVLTGFNTSTTAASLPAALDATICSNLTQRVCWTKLSVVVSRVNQHLADMAYSSCMFLSVIPGVVQQCVDTWRYASFAAWSVAKATDVICRLNSVGQSCAQVLTQPSLPFATCLATASMAKTCSAQCDAVVNETVVMTGCCVGFLADLRSAVLPLEFAMMQPPGVVPQGIRPTTPPRGVPSNPWAPLSVCHSTSNLSQTINDTCPYTLSPLKAVRRLQLRILWNYLANNATLRQLIVAALQRDLMTAAGLTASDLAEFNVTEDASLVLDIPNATEGTSKRQMAIQAATTSGSGVQVTLGIQTNDDTYTSGLAQSFDAALAEQTVSLPTTQEALQTQCPQCAAADPSGSLIVPPTATPEEESSHIGLIVGLVVAGVVVVLLVGALIITKVKRSRRGESEYRKIDDELR